MQTKSELKSWWKLFTKVVPVPPLIYSVLRAILHQSLSLTICRVFYQRNYMCNSVHLSFNMAFHKMTIMLEYILYVGVASSYESHTLSSPGPRLLPSLEAAGADLLPPAVQVGWRNRKPSLDRGCEGSLGSGDHVLTLAAAPPAGRDGGLAVLQVHTVRPPADTQAMFKHSCKLHKSQTDRLTPGTYTLYQTCHSVFKNKQYLASSRKQTYRGLTSWFLQLPSSVTHQGSVQ